LSFSLRLYLARLEAPFAPLACSNFDPIRNLHLESLVAFIQIRRNLLALSLVLAACASQQQSFSLQQLEGSWWSDSDSPTAAFAIHDGQIWLDSNSQFHALKLERGSVLVYDPGFGEIRRTIVECSRRRLVLEDERGTKTTYIRRASIP